MEEHGITSTPQTKAETTGRAHRLCYYRFVKLDTCYASTEPSYRSLTASQFTMSQNLSTYVPRSF